MSKKVNPSQIQLVRQSILKDGGSLKLKASSRRGPTQSKPKMAFLILKMKPNIVMIASKSKKL